MNNRATTRPPGNERFRPRERLFRKADFDRVFAERRSAGAALMTVHVAPNGLAWSRLGISVPRRVGNAVRRHYARRRIREAFRRHKQDLPTGWDIICVARPLVADPRTNIVAALLTLAAKAVRRRPLRDDPGRTSAVE